MVLKNFSENPRRINEDSLLEIYTLDLNSKFSAKRSFKFLRRVPSAHITTEITLTYMFFKPPCQILAFFFNLWGPLLRHMVGH